MSVCINKNSAEFQTLVKQSGLPDFYVSAICGNFVEKYNRFPYLDEIPGSNSQKYLESQLELKNGYSKISKILEMTGQDNVERSQIFLNNTLRDIEVSIVPLNQEAKVYITKRPITKELTNDTLDHTEMNNSLTIESIVHKLKNLYGVKVQSITLDEIQNSEMKNIPELSNRKTFIYNDVLYVNSDLFDQNAPILDMIQLLIAPIQGTELYKKLVKDENDTEALIEKISNPYVDYDIVYNIKRTLDTILMGESSVKDFQDSEIFNSSLSELCKKVNSELDVNNHSGTITEENGELSKMYEDIKQKQIDDGELKIYCNV